MLPSHVRALIAKQDGVVSRAQLRELGLGDNAIEVAVRRRELTRIGRGVYAADTGDPSWKQRVWAACLRYAPAVADPATTLALNDIGDPPGRIGVAVDWTRYVGGEKRVRVLRTRAFSDQALLDQHPPRLRLEHAAVEQAASLSSEQAVVGLLADVVGSRRTTAARLLERVDYTSRVSGRSLVRAVLTDLDEGASSNLERIYLHRVERAHSLPRGERQVRSRVQEKWTYRDVEYLGGLVVVELDGRLGHDTSDERWADAERDLATTMKGGRTLRLVWQQALESCRAASVVGALVGAVGWRGRLTRCGPTCTAA